MLLLPLGVPPTLVPPVLRTKSFPGHSGGWRVLTTTNDVGNATQGPGRSPSVTHW